MKTLGLTGGIGAGKSTVAQLFHQHQIAVFDSDHEAKSLYISSEDVRSQVILLLGDKAYTHQEPNFRYIASQVFEDQTLLNQLNAIIHPALQLQFEQWKKLQSSPFVVKEAAILFESGAFKQCDAVLTVTADTSIRLERVMQRDQQNAEAVEQRMSNQWPEARKIELSDFVLFNNGDFQQLRTEFDNLYPDIEFRLT